MPKVEVEVDQVLTVATAFSARPGDKLLIMHGVVVGALPMPDRQVMEKVIQPTAPTTPGRKKREEVLAVLRREGPKTARQLNRLLGFSVASSMTYLRGQRQVEATPATAKQRFPIWQAASPLNGRG